MAAAVGLLPRVDSLVGPDACQIGEPPIAEAACIRPFTRVGPPVDFQGPRLTEAFPAVGAAVGPSPRVHVEVDAQVAVGVEGPPTLRTKEAVRFVGMLRALVLQQL